MAKTTLGVSQKNHDDRTPPEKSRHVLVAGVEGQWRLDKQPDSG